MGIEKFAIETVLRAGNCEQQQTKRKHQLK